MPTYPSEKYRPGQPTPASRPQRPSLQGHPDIRSTKEYKSAARKWVSGMVALPIVLVTSYMLFDRIYGDKSQRRLSERKSQ